MCSENRTELLYTVCNPGMPTHDELPVNPTYLRVQIESLQRVNRIGKLGHIIVSYLVNTIQQAGSMNYGFKI